MSDVFEETVKICNKRGLHARAAAKFVATASRFSSAVTVAKNGLKVSGKSIMGLMLLAAAPGDEIHIRAKGKDAEKAVKALSKLVCDRFEEKA